MKHYLYMVILTIFMMGCVNESGKSDQKYDINFYTDTICGHLILTTVVVTGNEEHATISANSISLGKIDTTKIIPDS